MGPELGEETILRRLAIILALKESYIKAIGQPLGFDYTRLEFDVENRVRNQRLYVYINSTDCMYSESSRGQP